MVANWTDLEEHELPPKHIWTDGPKLRDWFRNIREDRKRAAGGDGRQPIEDPVENDAAKGLIVGG